MPILFDHTQGALIGSIFPEIGDSMLTPSEYWEFHPEVWNTADVDGRVVDDVVAAIAHLRTAAASTGADAHMFGFDLEWNTADRTTTGCPSRTRTVNIAPPGIMH